MFISIRKENSIAYPKILEGLEYIDDGSPILLAVQNRAGDVLNANLAYADALEKGIDIHKVLFYSVAFTKCTHPLNGLDIISLPETEIELGMGVHGKGGGANRIPMQRSEDLVQILESKNIHVYDGFCGSCLTTQELGGVSASLCKVDGECKKLWDAPCQCGIQCKPCCF